MIVTKELLQALGACQGGIDVLMANGLDGLPLYECMARYQNAPDPQVRQYLDWFAGTFNTPAFVKFNGDYTVTGYLVFNDKTGQHERFATQAEAVARRDELLAVLIAEARQRVAVHQEVTNSEGDSALERLDV